MRVRAGINGVGKEGLTGVLVCLICSGCLRIELERKSILGVGQKGDDGGTLSPMFVSSIPHPLPHTRLLHAE